jgi:ATPase subunit of ABC transporter with duplicated ATPase domains
LLRRLSTQVWIVHDRHVTTFDGGFAEWEVVSAERARAATVAAAEEERVRRVDEQKKTHRRDDATRSARTAVRAAQRRVTELEGEIQMFERQIAESTRELEDPELYVRPDGATRASALGRDLEALKDRLDRALDAWAAATEHADQLAAGLS